MTKRQIELIEMHMEEIGKRIDRTCERIDKKRENGQDVTKAENLLKILFAKLDGIACALQIMGYTYEFYSNNDDDFEKCKIFKIKNNI